MIKIKDINGSWRIINVSQSFYLNRIGLKKSNKELEMDLKAIAHDLNPLWVVAGIDNISILKNN